MRNEVKVEANNEAIRVGICECCGYENLDLQLNPYRKDWCCENCWEDIEENAITTSKIKRIKENMHIPNAGDEISGYRVVDVWDDEHYLIPEICLIIQKDHYDGFMQFVNGLPEYQQFVDSDTSPYKRTDDVVGPGYTTQIFYTDPATQRTVLVGFDDYPVICLDNNQGCYQDNCENWSVEDTLFEQ